MEATDAKEVPVFDGSDIFADFATDPKKELEGAWVPLGKGRILVARLGNRKYARVLAEKIEKNQEGLNTKGKTEDEIKAADALSDRLMAETLAETILLDWDDGIRYKGQSYSTAVATQALMHGDFRKRVMDEAAKFEHYRVAQEQALGNV